VALAACLIQAVLELTTQAILAVLPSTGRLVESSGWRLHDQD
jgi:hypothetical protein